MSEVAITILRQLGGDVFVRMTGASNFVSRADSLTCSIPRNLSGANKMRVTLDELDTYRVEFFYIRGVKVTTKKVVEMVYASDLAYVFENVTGLYTSL